MKTEIDVSGLIPEAQAIAKQGATIYCTYTAPWFIGLVAHGSAVKGGYIPKRQVWQFAHVQEIELMLERMIQFAKEVECVIVGMSMP